jgi:transcriptional regulator with XRE-family HTH domain
MAITGPQCRAARALVEWPREQIAKLSGVSVPAIAAFEREGRDPGAAEKQRLEHALTEGGAVFIAENGGGVGVRLKFNRRDVRAINKWEGEGGPAGEDDV